MQKKSRIPWFASIFILCGLIGAVLMRGILSSTIEANKKGTQATNQIQLIVFFVDEIEAKPPTLRKIWSVNIFNQDPKQITMFELTAPGNEDFSRISNQFSLDNQQNPSQKTINTLEHIYKMKWDAIVILDQQASKKFSKWLSDNLENALANEPNNIPNPNPENFCDYLILNNQVSLPKFSFDNFNNSDFHTTLSYEEIMSLTQFITASPPPKCKSLPTN